VTDTRSLRVRLTATFVGIGAVLVAAGSAGTAWLLHRAVWDPLDTALHQQAVGLGLLRETDEGAEAAEGHDEDEADDLAAAVKRLGAEHDLGAGKFVVITSTAGRRIVSSGHPPSILKSVDMGAMNESARFIHNGPLLYRAVAHRIPDFGVIMVGVRAERYIGVLRRAFLALGAGAIAMLAGIGLLAWSITARATNEIDALTNELEGLAADSMARRLEPRSTTEVARLAEALNRLLARLDLAVKRLHRFTADAAHELRTPLAALRAHLDVALARAPSIDAYRNGLLDASEQTERLAALAEDLLTLSAIESADLTAADAVDVGALANEVAEFLEAVAEEQRREFTVLMDSPATVRGDALLLKRLLLNLLGNAFAHTPHGTPVRLIVRRVDSGVEVTVRDHGPGISPDVRQVLFERFASRRTGAAGAGLGLAICREIVARHNGAIALESAVDQGTTVTVRLPALPRPKLTSLP
jgi:signal transduction histidine kinase